MTLNELADAVNVLYAEVWGRGVDPRVPGQLALDVAQLQRDWRAWRDEGLLFQDSAKLRGLRDRYAVLSAKARQLGMRKVPAYRTGPEQIEDAADAAVKAVQSFPGEALTGVAILALLWLVLSGKGQS